MKKQRIESIYFLRLFAMLMVVLVHVTGTYTSVLPIEGDAYGKYHFFNRFIRIEAGIFLMLTGLVFFYNYYRKNLSIKVFKEYYKKRVAYILVPYLLWALIYEIYAHYTVNRDLALGELIARIAQGQSYYQLHFIFLIVQFYLVFPLLIILAKRFVYFKRYMWLAAILIHLLYSYLNSKYGWVPFSLFLGSLSPYLLGGWLGIYYEEQKEKAHKHLITGLFGIIFIASGSLLAYLHYQLYVVQNFYLAGIYYTVVEIVFIMAGCYFLFRMAEIIQRKSSIQVMNIVKNIAMYSFGFYLIHPLVLKEVARFIPLHSNYLFHLEIITRYVLTVIICYIIIWLFHRFTPIPELLFGKMPAKKTSLREMIKKD
ncbi:acyltransferase [Oceanobacillus massiliensis]|uniref:acyltransferase n=1 Tax=Oceanobacillus massiliensis TaxID=1465765 RepID=UPI003019D038